MEVLGVWEEFCDYLYTHWCNSEKTYFIYNILTDGSKLVPAIEGFLKGREG
jgi:hypothetical protein